MFDIPAGYVVFSGDGCSRCVTLKDTLKARDIPYTEYDVYENQDALDFILSKGLRGIPQLFQDGELIKGAVIE